MVAEDNAAGMTSLTLSPASAPPRGARLRLGLAFPPPAVAGGLASEWPVSAGQQLRFGDRTRPPGPSGLSPQMLLKSQLLSCVDFSVKSLKSTEDPGRKSRLKDTAADVYGGGRGRG